MIKSLRLENFKRHETLYQEFEPGMVVIRGDNEMGKTSILHGIAYCLFGIKVLPTSLEDTVTWGKPVNTLKATLVITCEGVDYTITRSKAGAEVNYEGGKVTGQNEVSGFVESLFGVSSGNASSLVIASQGSIRGALSSGPKATIEIIENLANFDLLDNVIELVQANLLTGPTASAEAVLQSADLRLQLEQAKLIEPETADWECKAGELELVADGYEEKATEIIHKVDAARVALGSAMADAAEAEKLNGFVKMYTNAIDERQASIKRLSDTVSLRPDTESIAKASKAYADAVNADALVKEYNGMAKAMTDYPEDVWEGAEATLDEEIEKIESYVQDLQIDKRNAESDIKVFESQKVSGSVCGFCDQDVSQFPEVLRKNTKLEADIQVAWSRVATVNARLADETDTLTLLKKLKRLQTSFLMFESANVMAHKEQVPASLSWVGEIPKQVDAAYIQSKKGELDTLNVAATLATNAEAKLSAEHELIAEYTLKLDQAKTDLSALGLADQVEASQANYDELLATYNYYAGKAGDLRVEAGDVRSAVALELSDYAKAQATVADAAEDVEIAKKAVDDLVFNNALIKRLRAARPMIADKLWNVVLSAVSSYFSNMRGVVSVVTKASDGFKVDGHSVEGLSGSTLDILGLAIRLALTRTFLPAAPFLILDEPSAACSDSRTQQMTGFLMAFGFTQTLIVTHKDVDEGAANQLITI